MYTAKLSLKLSAKIDYGSYQDNADDILYGLIGAFVQNGQIADCHAHPNFVENEYLCVIVNLFNNDSLGEKYYNRYIKKILSKLNADDLKIEILGKEFESLDIAKPNETDALILTTYCYTNQSPIRSFEFDPIPIHYLPKTHQDNESYYNLICWQKDFQACDSLQMRCVVGEQWALAQMDDVNSELSKQGLEICQILKEKLGKPVYYDLYQYYILPDEQNRKCPKCGGEWLLTTRLHDRYDFKCDRCYLLSNFGVSEMA